MTVYDICFAANDYLMDIKSFYDYLIIRNGKLAMQKYLLKELTDQKNFIQSPNQSIISCKEPVFAFSELVDVLRSQEKVVLPKAPHPSSYRNSNAYFPVKSDPSTILRQANRAKKNSIKSLISLHQTEPNLSPFLPEYKSNFLN